jgi:glycosyltransferase involved in cell wall biosynthesis
VQPFDDHALHVAVVVPCYNVRAHVLGVIESIGPEVSSIYVVDDCCPERSGVYVEQHCRDPRVRVLFKERNEGVGGAVLTGYAAALAGGADVMVKLDGDGQMDPALIPGFVAPIRAGDADYTKGNRFFDLTHIQRMPTARILGNAALSFFAKASTGYWRLFDPTNGYTAIHAEVARRLPFDRISKRYFFETDMLFRLNTLRAAVVDVPMDAVYGDQVSNLRIRRIVFEFLGKHLRNTGKRIFYNYVLRDVSLASLELVIGLALVVTGATYGAWHWYVSASRGVVTPAGTVMLAALPVFLGIQLLLAFLAYDIAAAPTRAVHPAFRRRAHYLLPSGAGAPTAAGRGGAADVPGPSGVRQ